MANENIGGGEEFLGIEDVSGGATSFKVMAGAPENTLVLSPSVTGRPRLGMGTALPSAPVHFSTSESGMRLRLEEVNNDPQAYELRVGSGNWGFEIWDMNTLRTPFKIENGAASNSIRIMSNGNVGMGTNTAEVPMHVVRDTGFATDMMRLENNGGVVFRLKDTSPGGQEFTFQSNGGVFRIASPAVPGPEFIMDDFGNVTITGQITTAGSCSAGCDRVFSDDYDLKSLTEHNAMMWAQGHLPNVGPTPEDGPFNLTEKVGGMLNELEHAHIYIGQLHQQLEIQGQQMASQADQLERQATLITTLMARVDAVEAR